MNNKNRFEKKFVGGVVKVDISDRPVIYLRDKCMRKQKKKMVKTPECK